jgi:hypothetical protein
MFSWPMFSSFTENRDEAVEYGRAWRGGVSVIFELRSALCRRLRNGTYLLHPFAVLLVEAVTGNAVKLVGVELKEQLNTSPLPVRRQEVFPTLGKVMELRLAAESGDVRAIARIATGPELINARDAHGWTSLHHAVFSGKSEAVAAMLSLGATVDPIRKASMMGAMQQPSAPQNGREPVKCSSGISYEQAEGENE